MPDVRRIILPQSSVIGGTLALTTAAWNDDAMQYVSVEGAVAAIFRFVADRGVGNTGVFYDAARKISMGFDAANSNRVDGSGSGAEGGIAVLPTVITSFTGVNRTGYVLRVHSYSQSTGIWIPFACRTLRFSLRAATEDINLLSADGQVFYYAR